MKFILEGMIKNTKEDTLIIDIPGVKGWVRNKTIFSKNVPLIKVRYSFKGDINPHIFMDLLTSKRKLWDKEITQYEEFPIENDWVIYRYSMNPPMFLMNPMYFVEKRLLFEDEGTYYGYYSNVPDNILPLDKGYSRYHTIFGGTVLRKEKDEYAYYSLSQVDMNINSSVQNMLLRYVPGKIKTFYKTFKGVLYNL